MSTCEIRTLPSGAIRVETYPQLFREIQNYTNSQNKALALYGMTLTEEFKDLNLSNPTLEDLLQFVDNYNSFESKDLTKADRKMFMDMTLNTDEVENVKDLFIDSFTVDGIFAVNPTQMRSVGLFDENTILEMVNSEDLTQVQKLYYKLKENNEEFSNVVTPFNVSDGTQFGKLNPDKILTSVYENYIGLMTREEVTDKANSINDEFVINNPSIITPILQTVANKQLLVSYETDSDFSEVVKKEINNTRFTLENTLDAEQNFQPLINQVEVLLNLDIEQFAYDYNDVRSYISNVEKQASKLGIDINSLSEVIADRNFSEVQSYLNSLYNLLTDIQNQNTELLSESFGNYVEEHDSFFRVLPQFQNKVVDEVEGEGVYLDLETNRNEQDLFLERSIIKVGENTYQKITDNKTQAELNEMIYNTSNLLPKEVFSVRNIEANKDIILEDIDRYVTEQSRSLLNPFSDIDTLKRITSYKILTGVENEVKPLKPDSSYLRTDNINPEKFAIDFYKQMLKNPTLKDIFYFSNRGLEAKQEIGQYTINELQNELSESMFDKLTQYTLISNNSSLEALKPQYELLETDDVNVLRNFYSNNLSQLEELSLPYQVIGTGAIVENVADDFVKIRGELYEKTSPNVYEKIEIDTRFRNYGLKKPAQSIQNPERYLSPKSKEEKIKVKTTNIEDSEIEFC